MKLETLTSFEYVVNGAVLTCTGCPGKKSKLTVSSQSSVKVTRQLAATIMDKLPVINIAQFEMCELSSSGLCMPLVEEWIDFHPEKYITSFNALIKKSKAICEEKGVIEIHDTGQTTQAERNGKLRQDLENILNNSSLTKSEKLAEASRVLSKYNGKNVVVKDMDFHVIESNSNKKYMEIILDAPPSVSGSHSTEKLYPEITGNIEGLNNSGIFVGVTQDKYTEDYYSSSSPNVVKTEGKTTYIGSSGKDYYTPKERVSEMVSSYREIEGNADKIRAEHGGKIENFNRIIETGILKRGKALIPGIAGNVYLEKVSANGGKIDWQIYDPYGELYKRENAVYLKALSDKGITAKPSMINKAVQKEQMIFLREQMGPETYDEKYTNGKEVEQWSREKMAFDVVTGNIIAASTGSALKLPAPDSVIKSRNAAFGNSDSENLSKGKAKTGAGVNSKTTSVNKENSTETACFTAGTLIWSKTVRAVEDIRAGNNVYSYNELTKEIEEKEVLQTFMHEVKTVLSIYLRNGSVIRTTKEHPFYVGNEYVNAGDLRAGMLLLSKIYGKIEIERIEEENLEEPISVYNIEVDGNHNYFVGDSFVLVHNKPLKVTDYHSKKILENGLDIDHLKEFDINKRKEVKGAHIEKVFNNQENYSKYNKVLRVDEITEHPLNSNIKEINYSISGTLNSNGTVRTVEELNFKPSNNGKTVFNDKVISITQMETWGYEAAKKLSITEKGVIRGTSNNGIVFEFWAPDEDVSGLYKFYPTLNDMNEFN